MKAVFTLAVLLMTVLLMTTFVVAEEDEPKKPDKELLQGTWNVVAIEAGGQKAPDGTVKDRRFLFKGDKVSLSGMPEDLHPLRLDATAEPKAMDLGSNVEGEFSKAIYELKGDTLKVCFSQSTKLDRPKDFKTAGTRYFCFTLKREKP
jgi:uncharacterized protein (TIGR03067 family)